MGTSWASETSLVTERPTVDVTARELTLLADLARRADQVVSKSDILTHVWEAAEANPDVVEVCVAKLRRKFRSSEEVGITTPPCGIPASASRASLPRPR